MKSIVKNKIEEEKKEYAILNENNGTSCRKYKGRYTILLGGSIFSYKHSFFRRQCRLTKEHFQVTLFDFNETPNLNIKPEIYKLHNFFCD